jgi:hypothetical protein
MSFLTNRNGVSLSVSTNIALSSVPLSYRLAPSLLLDFTNTDILDPRITFTRASTATFTGSNGLLQTAAINAPRFDYNPTTLASLGLLIEEQRTNLILNSATLSTQNVTVTAVAHTLSFYGTGTVTLSGTSTAGPLVGTGAYPVRSTLTFTPTAGTLTLTVSGNVQFAQLEVGTFSTSYIPTVASQVTRSADNASMTGVNFSSWYNQSQGTLYANVLLQSAPSLGNAIAAISDNTNNNRLQLGASAASGGNLNFLVSNSGVIQANPLVGSISSVGPHKLAGAFAANNFQVSANGLLGTQDSSGTVPTTVNAFQIGAAGNPNGKGNLWIYRLAYYPRRLANSELQALTS